MFNFFFCCLIEFIPKMIFNGRALFSVHIVNEREKKTVLMKSDGGRNKEKKICPPGIWYY